MKITSTKHQHWKNRFISIIIGVALSAALAGPLFFRKDPELNEAVDFLPNVRRPLPNDEYVFNATTTCGRLNSPEVTLLDIHLPNIKYYSQKKAHAMAANTGYRNIWRFYPLLSVSSKLRLLKTYLALSKALEKANVSFALIDELLLGVYRFSGILPWDNTARIIADVRRKGRVWKALSCIEDFQLTLSATATWIFSPSYQGSIPFTISFFEDNSTHVIQIEDIGSDRAVYPRIIMLPLRTATMEGIRVPVPQNMQAVLSIIYRDLRVCSSPSWLQKNVTMASMDTTHMIPCVRLWPLYGRFTIPEKWSKFPV